MCILQSALHIKCRKSWSKSIPKNDLKVGFMVNESTTLSKKTALVILLHVKLPDLTDVSNFIFDTVEL
jgi:hypothetical protein